MKRIFHILVLFCLCLLDGKAASRYEMSLPKLDPTQIDFLSIKEALREAIHEFVQADDNDLQLLLFPTPTDSLQAGILRRLEISFRYGEIQGLEGLKIRRARVVITDLSLDISKLLQEKKLDVLQVGGMQFRVRLDEDDINHYLESTRRNLNLEQPRVAIKEGRVQFSARVKTMFFSSRVMTEGSFELNKEKQTIDFKAHQLKMNSIGVPRFALGTLVSKINPVVKLRNFSLVDFLSFSLDDIQTGSGFVEFFGS